MRIPLVLSFLFVVTYTTWAQTTLVLQPGQQIGKDAYLRSLSPNTNYGSHPDYSAHAWTNRGRPVTVRGIVEFDLSALPPQTTIISATLFLYSYESRNNGHHSTRSGSNAATISRVTSPWAESTVTWNNQPATTTQNRVGLPATTSSIQDYVVDVTAMVQDMVNDPANSYGFLFRLRNESYYRKMLFASSDNPDASLHPKLVIEFINDTNQVIPPDPNPGNPGNPGSPSDPGDPSDPTSPLCSFNEINVFTPNGDRINDIFFPEETIPNCPVQKARIYNRWGQLIWSSTYPTGGWDGREAPAGTYFYLITSEGRTYRGTLTLLR